MMIMMIIISLYFLPFFLHDKKERKMNSYPGCKHHLSSHTVLNAVLTTVIKCKVVLSVYFFWTRCDSVLPVMKDHTGVKLCGEAPSPPLSPRTQPWCQNRCSLIPPHRGSMKRKGAKVIHESTVCY